MACDPRFPWRPGKIIFTSSVHEVIPWAGHVNYAASKGGLMLLMKSLAQEVARNAHRRQLHCAGRDPYAYQFGGLVDTEAYAELTETGAVQTHR